MSNDLSDQNAKARKASSALTHELNNHLMKVIAIADMLENRLSSINVADEDLHRLVAMTKATAFEAASAIDAEDGFKTE